MSACPCGKCEGPTRPDWPMVGTPRCLWDVDYELDVEVIAGRLGGGAMDRFQLADAVGLKEDTIWTLVGRGKLPRPDEFVDRIETQGYPQRTGMWKAATVAQVLIKRGQVPA